MERAELEQQLTCVECGAHSDERAEAWKAHLAGGVVEGVDIGELEVGVYCPACAEAEFGGGQRLISANSPRVGSDPERASIG